jgi:hypothetical protein
MGFFWYHPTSTTGISKNIQQVQCQATLPPPHSMPSCTILRDGKTWGKSAKEVIGDWAHTSCGCPAEDASWALRRIASWQLGGRLASTASASAPLPSRTSRAARAIPTAADCGHLGCTTYHFGYMACMLTTLELTANGLARGVSMTYWPPGSCMPLRDLQTMQVGF